MLIRNFRTCIRLIEIEVMFFELALDFFELEVMVFELGLDFFLTWS